MFLLVNLLGFAGYYIHPAAPPWYVAGHGFEAVVGTRGEVAGLGAFDAMTGLGIFDGLYARNSNVFAALPSLHSAYTPCGVHICHAFRQFIGMESCPRRSYSGDMVHRCVHIPPLYHRCSGRE